MARPEVAARLATMVEDFSGWHWLHSRAGPGRAAAERVGEIRAPTLVVIGELDLPDFHRIADLLVARLPDARKVVIPGVGHMSNMEAPEAFNAAVLDFLVSV